MSSINSFHEQRKKGYEKEFSSNNLPKRHLVGRIWRYIYTLSTFFGILILAVLLLDIVNDSFGYIAISEKVPVASLSTDGTPLEMMPKSQLISILKEHLSKNRIKTLEKAKPLDELTEEALIAIIIEDVVQIQIEKVWGLFDSIFRKDEINAYMAQELPEATLTFTHWLDRAFITSPQSSSALYAGVRTAIMGSLYVIFITVAVAFPIGIGAAIYLQEYATDNWINQMIETNINNLAGVPSIIYGMLGLAIFVRVMAPLTSGALFGYPSADPNNGRTILSAGLTMSLLILPVIIINAQEAIKAVPNSIREAAFGVGATKWQTVWNHVLPSAMSGILTGTILSISRAFGETAPLIIVGATTYITFDPDGVFSKFTSLPVQIYQWAARPQDEFRSIAAAAIIVLMVLLLALNTTAILLRNRFSRRYQ